MTLRELCMKSPRLQSCDFIAFKKELGAIELHGLEDYIMSIYAKGIKVSNTSNSLVAWIIGITDDFPKDTVTYKGGSMPDIDIDLGDEDRQKVIDYVIQKYSDKRVCGIGSHGYLWAKGAIRMVGSALGYDQETINMVASKVPPLKQGRNWHIDEALSESEEFRELVEKNQAAKDIVRWAKRLDGTISNVTQHAAGYIIAGKDTDELIGTWRNSDNVPVSEFEMGEVEELGLTN